MWRWIFGLAVIPAGTLAWLVDGPEAGLLVLAASFIGAYPLGLLASFTLFFIALVAWVLAHDAWDFMLRLLGLDD